MTPTKTPKPLTVPQVAEILQVTPRRILALIGAGRLRARRCECGQNWLIERRAIATVRHRRPGRPPKNRR